MVTANRLTGKELDKQPHKGRGPQPAGLGLKLGCARGRGDTGFSGLVVGAYWPTTLIMSKIGKYIATIMPPTMTPKKTMSIGSMAESSASTAVSTSSS